MFKKWRSVFFSKREREGEHVHDLEVADSHPTAHSHELPTGVTGLSRPLRIVTFTLLAAVAATTAVGLFVLWPDAEQVAKVAERSGSVGQNVSYERGEVLAIEDGCVAPGQSGGAGQSQDTSSSSGEAAPRDRCVTMSVGLLSGPDTGRVVDVPVRGALASAGIQEGDKLELVSYPLAQGPPVDPQAGESADSKVDADPKVDSDQKADTSTNGSDTSRRYEAAKARYGVSGVFRGAPLALLGLVFAVVVVWVGRMRGLLSLVALGISAFLLLAFMLPALVSGQPGLPVALVGASAIMFVILYLVHGVNMRTTAALIGTLCGILIMAIISLVSVQATRLSGIGDESSGYLSAVATEIDFRGLLTCAIIIAGLGILNDVTITQSSAVWELRAAAPAMSRREVFARAMRIGRDHIASTVYTVFFAYVGASLSVLLLLYLYDSSVLSLLTREDIAVELVRTFCGSIGLILAVPITTWVAVLFTPPGEEERHEPWGERRESSDASSAWID